MTNLISALTLGHYLTLGAVLFCILSLIHI